MLGSRVWEYYREFLTLEKKEPKQLQKLQIKRLATILNHASKNIPFYQKHVSCRKDLSLNDFPVLTKDDILSNFHELMSNVLREQYAKNSASGSGYSWKKVQTGGSTGVPTTVIHDKEYRDRGRAGRLYSQYLCGFPFGVPYFRLWGSMKEINQMNDSYVQQIVRFLSNESLLNAFKMGDKDIEKYIKIMNSSSISHIMAYVDAIDHIAKYALKKGKKLKPFKSIMACAGTVTDDLKQTLKHAFHASIHNKYGSRECAEIACECEAGGFHIFSNNIVIEIVDPQGKPMKMGKSGRVLVTLLSNYSFPLIRYEIGDVGALSEDICSCGRPFPLMAILEGRHVEFLIDNEGGYVSPLYIIHLIGVVYNPGCIRRFQLIQRSLNNYDLTMVIEQDVSDSIIADITQKIKRDLKAVFGKQSVIKIKHAEEIPVTSSGKFLYTINKVSNSTI